MQGLVGCAKLRWIGGVCYGAGTDGLCCDWWFMELPGIGEFLYCTGIELCWDCGLCDSVGIVGLLYSGGINRLCECAGIGEFYCTIVLVLRNSAGIGGYVTLLGLDGYFPVLGLVSSTVPLCWY
jgi:hypothetical protein